MGQITITLSDERQRALEAEAQARGLTVEALIKERLEPSREETAHRLRAILDAAARNWQEEAPEMTEDEVMDFAVEEVRRYRQEKWEREHGADNDHR